MGRGGGGGGGYAAHFLVDCGLRRDLQVLLDDVCTMWEQESV